MARQRSIESQIKEHRKFREQCRRRIRPSIILFTICLVGVIAWVCFLPTWWWMVTGMLVFTGGHVAMEIIGYMHNDRKLNDLESTQDKSACS
jgi:fatty acid desaturase